MAVKTIEQEASSEAEDAATAVAAPECHHHWVIASPNGAMSLGKCKICGTGEGVPELRRGRPLGARGTAVALDRPHRDEELEPGF